MTYSCHSGYTLSGSATIICQASGSWEAPPMCTPIGKYCTWHVTVMFSDIYSDFKSAWPEAFFLFCMQSLKFETTGVLSQDPPPCNF